MKKLPFFLAIILLFTACQNQNINLVEKSVNNENNNSPGVSTSSAPSPETASVENSDETEEKGDENSPNTPIKNFLKEFFKNENPYNTNHVPEIALNKVGDHLKIVVENWGGMAPSPWWFFADSHCSSNFLPRKEEPKISELEKSLQEKFGIEKISLTYRFFDESFEVYRDHKFVYEDVIVGLSSDGRFAELDLSYYFTSPTYNKKFGLLYDMKSGKEVEMPAHEKFSCLHRYDCRGTSEEEGEYCLNAIQNLRKEKNIQTIQDRGDAFLKEIVPLPDDIELFFKKVSYPSNIDFSELGIQPNMININLRHSTTGEEITIKTINQPQCILDPVGFYGHSRMQGLVFIYFDSGCYWQYPHEEIFSQEFLDQKLARLYNSVGMRSYQDKDYRQALQYFEKAVSKDPSYAQAFFNKAAMHALLKQDDAALENLQKAIQLDPRTFKEKAKTDPDFQDLRTLETFKKLID